MTLVRWWERVTKSGYFALYEAQRDRNVSLTNDLNWLRHQNAELTLALEAERTDRTVLAQAHRREFAYATDEGIQKAAQGYEDETIREIARLTQMLAREHARVVELSASNTELIGRLKAYRKKERERA